MFTVSNMTESKRACLLTFPLSQVPWPIQRGTHSSFQVDNKVNHRDLTLASSTCGKEPGNIGWFKPWTSSSSDRAPPIRLRNKIMWTYDSLKTSFVLLSLSFSENLHTCPHKNHMIILKKLERGTMNHDRVEVTPECSRLFPLRERARV